MFMTPTLWQKLESLDNQLDAELLLELETKCSIHRTLNYVAD